MRAGNGVSVRYCSANPHHPLRRLTKTPATTQTPTKNAAAATGTSAGFCCIHSAMTLDPNRIRLLVYLGPACSLACPLEPTLQKAEQTGVPVPQHEEQKERHRDVVLSRHCIPDCPCKVSSDRQFNPRHNPQPLAIDLCLRRLALLLHPILWGTCGRRLDAEQRLHHRFGIGDR